MNAQDYTYHWFRLRKVADLCTAHLMRQAAYAYAEYGCEPDAIAQAIQANEQGKRGMMQRAGRFRRAPLKGVFKLHFQVTGASMPASMATNILNEDGKPMRQKQIDALLNRHEGKPVTQEILSETISSLVDGALEDRANQGRLTGEWVIFEKSKKGRRYLTIASHDEDDAVISQRIAAVKAQTSLILFDPNPP